MKLLYAQLDANLIKSGGNYSPFVFVDAEGVHVGDQDNHEIFPSAKLAKKHVAQYILPSRKLAAARRADTHSNDYAESLWHEDACLQLDSINLISESHAGELMASARQLERNLSALLSAATAKE